VLVVVVVWCMWCRVISGEEEGVFGWIAVNYLNGRLFKPPTDIHHPTTVGALDMGHTPAPHHATPLLSTAASCCNGCAAAVLRCVCWGWGRAGGASTQITFQPPHDVLANYFPFYMKDRQIRLYTHCMGAFSFSITQPVIARSADDF
jgi:hypothetical protein